MDEFWLYLEVGYRHILDIKAYDHIVFLLALSAVFSLRQWKSLVICLTAFTIGHSATLILSVLDIFTMDPEFIELLIPATIVVTGILNTFERQDSRQHAFSANKKPRTYFLRYSMALLFGLIHGLGFSYYLKSLLLAEDDLILPLVGFNLGIELGQIIFIIGLLLVAFVWITVMNRRKYHWNLFLSGAAVGIASMLLVEKLI